MRIAYLNPVGALGGAEQSLLDFLASLRKADNSVKLDLITGTEGPLADEAERLGVRAHVLPMPRCLTQLGDSTFSFSGGTWPRKAWAMTWRTLAGSVGACHYLRQLRAEVQALAPDLIHSNGIKCHLLTGMLRLPNVPVLWHIHDFLTPRPMVSRMARWLSKSVAHAVANSKAVEADVRALLPNLPTETIYYGIDVDHFCPGVGNGDHLDRLGGLSPGGPECLRVGLLATYARWKGQDVFLEAVANLCSSPLKQRARFFIIGGPIYTTHGSQFTEPELRARAARLGIGAHVGFIPFQKDTSWIYRSLDVVVHASTKPEPFGRTIVEAMACGRVVVATSAGGAAELFLPGTDALGVRPNDPAELAAAIRSLIDDPALRIRLAENARNSAVEKFSHHRLGPQLLTAYRRLINSPSARPS